jgi:hypothetical protein
MARDRRIQTMTKPNLSTYTARSIWSPARPETLVVCCSDGRWHAPILEFVNHAVSDRADLYAVPGGPAAFDPWNSSFEEARVLDQAMRMFVQYHNLHSVWLIQHAQCAYYRMKNPHVEDADIEARQAADMHRAIEVVRMRYPHLAVRAIQASLDGNRAKFTELEASDSVPQASSSFTTLF